MKRKILAVSLVLLFLLLITSTAFADDFYNGTCKNLFTTGATATQSSTTSIKESTYNCFYTVGDNNYNCNKEEYLVLGSIRKSDSIFVGSGADHPLTAYNNGTYNMQVRNYLHYGVYYMHTAGYLFDE